jgi:pilus assembly protein CpaF
VGSPHKHAEQVAAELRARLIDRRRAEAAAGRSAGDDLTEAIEDLVDTDAAVLSPSLRGEIRELILRDTVGLGPLEELPADPRVEEVMVNGPDEIYVERGGRIERAGVRFASE